jgi:hypothetical protein
VAYILSWHGHHQLEQQHPLLQRLHHSGHVPTAVAVQMKADMLQQRHPPCNHYCDDVVPIMLRLSEVQKLHFLRRTRRIVIPTTLSTTITVTVFRHLSYR